MYSLQEEERRSQQVQISGPDFENLENFAALRNQGNDLQTK